MCVCVCDEGVKLHKQMEFQRYTEVLIELCRYSKLIAWILRCSADAPWGVYQDEMNTINGERWKMLNRRDNFPANHLFTQLK